LHVPYKVSLFQFSHFFSLSPFPPFSFFHHRALVVQEGHSDEARSEEKMQLSAPLIQLTSHSPDMDGFSDV
jgi:hypothetical protein